MTVKSTGKRTFFHQRGANALLSESAFDFSLSHSKIFHLGYLLLLDKLDIVEADGSTGASRLFQQASEAGFLTSADIVSEKSDRFSIVIPPSLPYIDYLFVNEFEAAQIAQIDTLIDGKISKELCIQAARQILNIGVRKWVVLHCPDGVIAVGKDGQLCSQASLQVPAAKIVGAVGAGDAFAAGVLYGIHEDWDMDASLALGVSAAASSLLAATCSDSILPVQSCLALKEAWGVHPNY
jgi:sugar/nucleoside kinase (ribokinase family)